MGFNDDDLRDALTFIRRSLLSFSAHSTAARYHTHCRSLHRVMNFVLDDDDITQLDFADMRMYPHNFSIQVSSRIPFLCNFADPTFYFFFEVVK